MGVFHVHEGLLAPEVKVLIVMPRQEKGIPKIVPLPEAKITKGDGQLLAAHISQVKRYPHIAQRRGWEAE